MTNPTPGTGHLRARVAAEVRAWRARLRITQKEMGLLLGLSQASISARMNGAAAFTIDELEVLAERFGCDPADLLAAAGPPREVDAAPPAASRNGTADSRCRLHLIPALLTA